MGSSSADLRDVWVVVTRPAHQADGITTQIEDAGGSVIRCPVIEIKPPRCVDRLEKLLHRLPEFDWLIFISANAVTMGMTAILDTRSNISHAKIAAVGIQTARALRQAGWIADLVARPPFNSEALLSEPQMEQVDGLRFLIFRGEGGRELLRESLQNRGARVEYAECYRRVPASVDLTFLDRAWSQNQLDVIMVTSVEVLNNLVDALGRTRRRRLTSTPLVAAGQRVAQSARDKGWLAPVIVATNAADDAMLTALQAWHQRDLGDK